MLALSHSEAQSMQLRYNSEEVKELLSNSYAQAGTKNTMYDETDLPMQVHKIYPTKYLTQELLDFRASVCNVV